MDKPLLTARVPDKLTILLTHRCNQTCEFCFEASNVLCAGAASDLSFETLDAVLDLVGRSVTDRSRFNVTLSGGEPTVHPRFLEIVARVSDAGFPVTILSNGQRFGDRDFMKRVLRHNIWNFQFAVEGASAATHDRRTGCPGPFLN